MNSSEQSFPKVSSFSEYGLSSAPSPVLTPLPLEEYNKAHRSLVIACHDVFIAYQEGILLAYRENVPAKSQLFPVGGRLLKNLPAEESLKLKARQECGLEISDIHFLGVGRTVFPDDPFGHGQGTDTINLVYFAQGAGNIRLDSQHSRFLLVTREMFTPEFQRSLPDYVSFFLAKAMRMI
jgi:ADP-ribose pyrophosphatase YjhB (NUDIX family)